MCGQETPSSTPRIGARVDFFSPTSPGKAATSLGNLLFLNPSTPSSTHATHVRFQHPSPSNLDGRLLVSIHLTGDLTKPLSDSGLMQQFTLSRSHSSTDTDETTMPLASALSLNVGNDGIIGRRVSMRRGNELLADGIVGFNFLPEVTASS